MIPGTQAADPQLSSTSSSSSPASFAVEITRIAVAQICRSAGFRSSESSALDSLCDIASLYIRYLSNFARLHAEASGRTDGNLVDVVLAIEDLASYRGFAGASNTSSRIAESSVLAGIFSFISLADETPFRKRIPRLNVRDESELPPSFSVLGIEPPFRHVPNWLPAFPEGFKCRKGAKEDESTEDHCPIPEVALNNRRMGSGPLRTSLPSERERIRFEFGICEKRMDECLEAFDSNKRKSWLGNILERRVKIRIV